MASLPQRRKLYAVSFDIEKGGEKFDVDKILSVGICIGCVTTGVLMEKLIWCLEHDYEKDVNDRVKRELFENPDEKKREPWEKSLKFIRENMTDRYICAKDIFECVSGVVKRNGIQLQEFDSEGKPKHSVYDEIELVSDNPYFDLAELDRMLQEHKLTDRPIRYAATGNYISVTDPSERISGLKDCELENMCYDYANKKCPHNHRADNDATNIFYQYVAWYHMCTRDRIITLD